MIDDSERREVARRLRGIDAERLDRVYGMDGESGTCEDPWMSQAGRELMLGAIAEAVGLRFAPYYFDAVQLRDRLAGLVEPAPPHCIAEVKISGDELEGCVNRAITEYTGIDLDALLALADEIEERAGLVGYARRIREASGVEHAES